MERGEQTIVGVNRFTMEESPSVPLLRINPELERQQVESLDRVRARRDAREVPEALEQIERAARTDENLMPHIIRAVEAYATLGEISDRLRAIFGEYPGANHE